MSCDDLTAKHSTLLECEYETLKDSDDSFSFLICPICQDQFETPILQCSAGHAFCKPCIEFWLTKKSNCPSCRKSMTKSSLCRNLVLEQAIEELIVCIADKCADNFLQSRKLVLKSQFREKKCFINNSADTSSRKVPLMAIISPWNVFSFLVTFGFLVFLARDISLAFVERHNSSVLSPSLSSVEQISPEITSYTNVCNTTLLPLYVEKSTQLDEEGHLPLSKVMEELSYHAYHTWKNVLQWKKARNAESLVMKLRGQLRPVFDWIIDVAEVVGKNMMFLTVEIIKWIVIFVVMLVDFAYTATFICLGLLFELFEAQAF